MCAKLRDIIVAMKKRNLSYLGSVMQGKDDEYMEAIISGEREMGSKIRLMIRSQETDLAENLMNNIIGEPCGGIKRRIVREYLSKRVPKYTLSKKTARLIMAMPLEKTL